MKIFQQNSHVLFQVVLYFSLLLTFYTSVKYKRIKELHKEIEKLNEEIYQLEIIFNKKREEI